MPDEYSKILQYIKPKHIDPIAARVKVVEEQLKKHEGILKDALTAAAAKEEINRQYARVEAGMKVQSNQAAFEREKLTKAYTELVNVEIAKMEKKLSKNELLEARLKGMEMMIRSMEQTIDMLQRKR